MALIVKDRVKQQTTTTGTGTYTLSGSFDSFQTFAEIGDGNTTYYCCTDGTDFEIGIGTYTASGTTLARTTILQSSNSDAAVNWTSGTRTIFCTQPADKAVFLNASDNIELADNEKIILGNSGDLEISHDGSNSVIKEGGDGLLDIKSSYARFTSVDGSKTTATFAHTTGASGGAQLYYDGTKKFETKSDGVDITGELQSDTLDVDGNADISGTLTMGGDIVVEDTSSSSASPYVEVVGKRSDANDSYAFAGKLFLSVNRTDQLVDENKVLGIIGFGGNHTDGTLANTLYSSTILARSDGDFNSASDMPSRLEFYTGSTGQGKDTANVNVGTERLRITSGGDVQVKTGHLELGDDQELRLGDSDDLKIYHDGSNSYIQDSGTGGLVIMTTGPTIGLAKSYESSESGFEWMLEAIPNGSVKLRYDSAQKLSTTSSGIDVIGTVTDDGATHDGDVTFTGDNYNVVWDKSQDRLEFADNASATFGDGADLRLFHNGSISYIQDAGTGGLRIIGNSVKLMNAANDETMLAVTEDGAVELYYDAVKTFQTLSTGALVQSNSTGAQLEIRNTNNNTGQSRLTFSTDDGSTYNQFRYSWDDDEFQWWKSSNNIMNLSEGGLTITSQENHSPILKLVSNDPADAADFHAEGQIQFFAENSNSQSVEYAQIKMTTADITDGTEDGRIAFNVIENGSLAQTVQMGAGYLFLKNDTHRIQWENTRGTSFDVDLITATPTDNRTITLPDATGTVLLSDSSGDITFEGDNYNVVWDKSDNALELADNALIKVGAGDDMTISSDGTYPRIKANNIIVESDNVDQAIYFRSNDTGEIVDYDTGTQFYFQQLNDNNEQTTYNRLLSISLDVTDGSEDGRFQFQSLKNGANTNTFIIDPYYIYLMSEQSLSWYQFNGSHTTNLSPLTPTATRYIKLPDRDGVVQVVDRQVMTANLAVGWHTIAVFQGLDDSPQGANQRFHAKFTLLEYTSSRHQAFTFYAQHMYGRDEGLQVIGNSTFGTDVVTAIRIKSSTDGNATYAGAAIQVYVANATNNLILYLDEADFDHDESGTTYGNVILKNGVADANDPGDVGYSTATWSTFAEDVQIGIDSIEPGGIGVTGNLLTQSNIVLEGATADAHETIITATDPTADRTITLPDATGQVVLSDGEINTNASAEIGRAHIGHMGHNDYAGFSHLDQNGPTTYALLQHPSGFTYLNAASGTDILFRIANVDTMTMDETGLHLKKALIENAYECTGTALDPSNGTLQYKTLSANTTFTESFVDGESITLMIDDGSGYTVTWPTMTWASGSAPTLATSGYTTVVLWHRGGLYGAVVS